MRCFVGPNGVRPRASAARPYTPLPGGAAKGPEPQGFCLFLSLVTCHSSPVTALAASTGRIYHPNVVTIYESGQADDGTPYIAMEFLEGELLHQALARRGALPVPEVAEILQQAARGLNAAHKLGIIHRDLKPDNIFLTYPDDVGAPLVGAHDAVAFAQDVGAGLVPALPVGIADTGRAQGPPLGHASSHLRM